MEHASKLDPRFRAVQAAGIRTLAARIWLTKGLGMSSANRGAAARPSGSCGDGVPRSESLLAAAARSRRREARRAPTGNLHQRAR